MPAITTVTAALMSPSMDGTSASGAATMSLGSYAAARRRYEHRDKSRTLMVIVALALGLVVAGAAIYVASPLGSGSGGPTSAAFLPAPTGDPQDQDDGAERAPAAVDATNVAVDATNLVEPEEGLDQVADASLGTDEASSSELAPVAELPAEPGLEELPEPATAVTVPIDAAVELPSQDPVTADLLVDPAPADPAPADPAPADPAPADRVLRRNGWVCDGQLQLQDPLGRDWALGKVSFLDRPGYERVVLHISRIRQGSGQPASVTAEAFPTSVVRNNVPNVRQPKRGNTTVVMHLADGIKGNLGLRGYRPSGLSTLKEFSVYPAARGSSRVLVSAAAGECFKLRVPAWSGAARNPNKAQIWLDIKE